MAPSGSQRLDDGLFEIISEAGDARSGVLRIDDTELETPNLLPVVNFYAGGTDSSLYGGGIHRTIKEFINGDDVVNGGDYSRYFDGVMTSVSSLTDYGISRERYEDYISEPIRDRDVFDFNGTLFLDSGGFKFLGDGTLDGSDFEVEVDQEAIVEIQRKLGGDVLVNLDRPIEPDDDYLTRVEKARLTAENVDEFLNLTTRDDTRYLTLHGYNYSMLDTFLTEIEKVIGQDRVHREFDGVALGSLVPLKDNKGKLITAVSDCREVLSDWGFEELPLHVLGISSSAIPLLAAVGADTFDSSSYIHSAINGKYDTSLYNSEPIDEVDFTECDCQVCSDDVLVNRMEGNVEYQKDKLGTVAMHNLIIQKEEIKRIQSAIQTPGDEALISYIEQSLGREKSMQQHAHRVVNESLGGYF
ncbi:tRNA-guanine family transglycosylase [Halopenitus malekzadehii]|uniref:tRNA-guanine family transglycosylase n=1 Tax=Halopenitus malekzadehii TaxID=1267564 RepID=A0A1H6J6G9_9EURY|nr:tRNA-guanine transglycosylase [Halopenitus malekzadehii]SEH56329.1 tRNA-guanine family transglycosylase [Halopenitus malekzadehii]